MINSQLVDTKWYERNFNDDYLKIYEQRNEENAQVEFEKIFALLNVKPGQKVLDLCCGQGRHSRFLANKGLRVYGVDLSAQLLAEALVQSLGYQIQYMRADARELPFTDEMDLVVNLATSFGYFTEDDENEKVIKQVSKALVSGGFFVLDYLNPEYLKENLVPSSRSQKGEVIIEQRREISEGFVKKEIDIYEGNEKRQYEEQIKLYSSHEIKDMLKRNHLSVKYLLGDYNANVYHEKESPRMIFICTKI